MGDKRQNVVKRMVMEDFNAIFREKTKALALSIIEELSVLPYSDSLSIVRKQVIRSATSIAANYRAACRSRSDREKYAKMCIVVEEADETLFWLEMIESLKYLQEPSIIILKEKAEEIVKVMASYRKKLKHQ
jgi:four helix bundle protein